jgi:hypothetical protein
LSYPTCIHLGKPVTLCSKIDRSTFFVKQVFLS